MKNSKKRKIAIFSIKGWYLSSDLLFIVVGFLLVIVGSFMIGKDLVNKSRCSERVTAKVVDYHSKESHSSEDKIETVYAPVYEYFYNDRKYRVKDPAYSDKKDYAVDSEITLRIDPDKPDRIYSPGGRTNTKKTAGVMIVGAIVAVLFIIHYRRSVKDAIEIADSFIGEDEGE